MVTLFVNKLLVSHRTVKIRIFLVPVMTLCTWNILTTTADTLTTTLLLIARLGGNPRFASMETKGAVYECHETDFQTEWSVFLSLLTSDDVVIFSFSKVYSSQCICCFQVWFFSGVVLKVI